MNELKHINNSDKGLIASIKEFYFSIASKKTFWLPVLLFTLLAYGFSLSRNTMSIDDMAIDLYNGYDGMMVRSFRWGMEFWNFLFGVSGYSAYIYKFFGVLFLVCSSFFMCCIFYIISKKTEVKAFPYTFFASVFITYPLINEIWEYNGANSYVTGNLMIVMFVILFQICSRSKYCIKIIISGLLMTLPVSSYESVTFVYITVVFSVLFYQNCIVTDKDTVNNRKNSWLMEGVKYAIPLVISVLLKYFIGSILLVVQQVSYMPMGDISINWGDLSIGRLFSLSLNTVEKYLLLINYYPIYIFLIALIVFIIILIKTCIIRKSWLPIIIGICTIISLFALSILQFSVLKFRTAQTLNYFVAFVVFLMCHNIRMIKWKTVKVVIVVLITMLTIWQSTYLSQVLEWNNQRSENEISIVRNLGVELTKDYKDKEIVFCGSYALGEYLTEKPINGVKSPLNNLLQSLITQISYHKNRYSSKPMDTNINSCLNWAVSSGFPSVTKRIFSYCGFDLNVRDVSSDEYIEYTNYAESINMNTFEVKDIGECVLVYLG